MVNEKSSGTMFSFRVVYLYLCFTIGGHVKADYREFIANSGSTVTFNCFNTHPKYDNITWWRNDSVELVAQKGSDFEHFSGDYNNRLRFSGETKKLMIFDCEGSDHGFYFCETKYRHERRRGGYYNLIVEEGPTCDKTVPDINVLNGSSAILPCTVRGTPKPKYLWHKVVGNKEVKLGPRFSASDTGLVIHDASPDDSGTYKVTLENKIDTFYHEILLNVKTLKSISSNNHKSTHLRSNVTFSCGESPSKKDTSVRWITSSGRDVALLDRFTVSEDGSLIITSVQLIDSGLYTCKKRSKIGSGFFTQSVLVYLDVQFKPVIDFMKHEVKVYENNRALIPCKADGNPKPEYRWLFSDGQVVKNSNKHEILRNGSMIVHNVRVSDIMNFTCIPYNEVGEGKPGHTQLSVIVSPYFLLKRNEIIRARVGDQIRINCTAYGLPTPRVTWKFTNKNNESSIGDKRKIMNVSGLFGIDKIKKADEGTYVCIAQSVAGKALRQIQLIILSKPEVPRNFFVETLNRSMSFSWKPGYDGGAKQSYELWYRPIDKSDYDWSSVHVTSSKYQIHHSDTDSADKNGVSFYCSVRSENAEGYSEFTYIVKTAKLLPHGRKLPGITLRSPLSKSPLAPYDFYVNIYDKKYELKWKYVLTPGRPASQKFVIEYRENNSTSKWESFTRKVRTRRSSNTEKRKQNSINIKAGDIPGVQHPLIFRIFSISASGVRSKAASPTVQDRSKTALTGKTIASIDNNLIPPIVMGVIFGLFTVLIIIGLYCYCDRKKKRLTSKESKASLVANDNNNITIDRNSLELRDSSKLLTPENKDMPTRYHLSTCPALQLGESSHPTDASQPDDVFVLLEPNAGENAVCTCSKKYVTQEQLKTDDKKRSLYKSSSLPSVLFTSDADVSSVDPSVDSRDFGGIDHKKDGRHTLDKDAISRLQRGGLFRDSYDKFCRSASSSKDASRVPSTSIPVVEKRNLNKLPETDNSSTATPVVETANILRRDIIDDDENPETKSIKSNKSIDGKSSGFGDGDSSTSDPDSIELDRFETPTQLKEAASHLLTAISKKDTGYFSDVPTRLSPLFINNHKFHPIQKHRLGTKGTHSGYFSEDETVTRLPYRPLQPPSYNQAIIDIERMTECNDIADSENMCKKLLEMERKMGVKLDDSLENNLDKVIIEPPSRFQNPYLDTGYMSDVSSTLKTRYTNKEKNERCAKLLNEFKIYRNPVNSVDFTEGIVEEELPPPGSTPKHIARSISAVEEIISEEPLSNLKRSNSTNSNIFNEWLV